MHMLGQTMHMLRSDRNTTIADNDMLCQQSRYDQQQY